MPERNPYAGKYPKHFEAVLTTPHEHESEHRKPLWLLWKRRAEHLSNAPDELPQLDCVCDSLESARYHLMALHEGDTSRLQVWVERIPANHRFASSMSRHFLDATLSTVKFFREWGQA